MSSLSYTAGFLVWILTLPGVVETPAVRSRPLLDGMVRQAAQTPAPAQPRTQAQTPAPPTPSPAASSTTAERPGREFFVSWGYNGDSYSKSDLHISQPSLGNDFTFVGVRARDSKGWTDGLFSHSLTVPQYNIRFGLFLNEKWGLEVAMDHFKWIVKEDQEVRATGMLNGSAVDTPMVLTADVLRYQLNNGANPIFINLLRRYKLVDKPSRTGNIAVLLKAGGGFAVPHTENTV